MHETSKAQKRRLADNNFNWVEVFVGRGLDVGSGDDPLVLPNREIVCIDLPDGGGDDITQFVTGKFDFVHGSQVLEHALDPNVMIQSWLKVLKPRGFIIATVPDWVLYEGRVWPSQWNQGHTHAWTLNYHELGDQRTLEVPLIYVPQFIDSLNAESLLEHQVTTNYDHEIGTSIDQTYDPDKGVEAFIEFVLQKK